MPRIYQGSFNSGEIAPSLYGRVDVERFHVGARVLRNGFPKAEGGFIKRPGMQQVGFSLSALANAPVDLIPFVFNNEQTYMLAVETWGFAVIKDGGYVTE